MALSPYTFNNLPAVRPYPLPRPWPAWVYERHIEQARAMYAAYDAPMRSWPAPEEIVNGLRIGRLFVERSRQREHQALIKALKKFKVKDTPRIIPFKGIIVKHAIQRFKVWRSKRQAHALEDWNNRRQKSLSQFS